MPNVSRSNRAIHRARRSPQSAGNALRAIIPSECWSNALKWLGQSVEISHHASPPKWGLRLNRDSIMLKVGFVEVLQIVRIIDFSDRMDFHFLLDHDLIPQRLKAGRRFRFTRSPYKNAPHCDTCDTRISNIVQAHKALFPAHESAIRIAARSPRRRDTIRDHSPGLVDFISQQLGKPLPQPAYGKLPVEACSLGGEEVYLGRRFEEGGKIAMQVNRYERDPRIKEECIKQWGTNCVACGVSMADRYGPQVTDLIHVHHLKPLAELGKRVRVDPIHDLRPVCPNCHAVIHSISPPRTIEEVKKMLRH